MFFFTCASFGLLSFPLRRSAQDLVFGFSGLEVPREVLYVFFVPGLLFVLLGCRGYLCA